MIAFSTSIQTLQCFMYVGTSESPPSFLLADRCSNTQTMDELFLLPPAPMAMPRAYWLGFDDRVLSSQIMLLQPSEFEFRRVFKQIETAASTDYDMEIVNTLYRDSALLLPHRPYNLLTGEFRNIEPNTHDKYLGNDEERWDPQAAYREAKFLHFSDWPYPKVIKIPQLPWKETLPNYLSTAVDRSQC